ncbi:MAG: four helix bundle protein [Saprospiraceae bacterium]
MGKTYLTIDKIDAYVASFNLSNKVWHTVLKWENFEQRTVGQQLARACDSISANIAEGFGRYHKKDKINFYKYSYGSMEETKDWLRKATVRKLITEDEKTEF